MNDQKIKILFRLRSLEMGGVPRVILDLLRNLPKDQFDLSLMLNLYQGELIREIPAGIKLIVVEKGKEQMSPNPFLHKLQLIWRRLKLEIYEKFPSVLYQIKVREKYDIEIASSYAEFDMVLSSPDKNSRKIAWFHTDVTYDTNQERARERIETMKKFDHVIFCAAHIRDVIKKYYNVTYPGSSVVYNAIHTDEVKEKALAFDVNYEGLKKPVFCSVGRLHSRKGYHTLINIHRRLIDEGFEHSIVVLGDGEEKNNLTGQINQLEVQDSFKLLGTKINPYPYIKNADCFVLPTRSEAYPLVINEALALEKPIISTNVGGIPEMIEDGVDGILVNDNEEELYEAMRKVFTQPELLDIIKQNTKESYKKLDSQKIYNQVAEILEEQYHLKLNNERG
ncbi:Glycosyltransferase involved in cell wall bisynthesis [Epilithonimonas bovis DSM 19482]|uniref:Glycosyltransferase involved in cell wall bisynthesis n=1 Tax=Epilithonimonas bovis DSM 19482 TaxID=1121284 RepID=A0A1U7PZT5_9FLAO|nr:glycosyltransferase [Epilithonimonas bovis]SIT97398.1 Glycosyltransferase involved in cell wall bisynthesis [Epilithonimonas bovis DSM 19482]